MKTLLISAAILAATVHSAFSATVATYGFNNTFAADQAGKPALTPVNPLGQSLFVNDVVLGQPRRVWAFNGNTAPASQAGLTLNTTGLVSPTLYSVEMVFMFNGTSNYRRVLEVQNRASDAGPYIDPSDNFFVYSSGPSSDGWVDSVYNHVVLTNAGSLVTTYVNGGNQASAATTQMNLNNASNPGRLMNFFLDNLTGANSEWSSGRVALVRVWDHTLSPTEVAQLAANPFAPVPEPSSLMLAVVAVIGGGWCIRRTRLRTAGVIAVMVGASLAQSSYAATIAATYSFNNTLAANEPGKPTLAAINPLGTNGFLSNVVYGSSRQVYAFNGNASPNNQQAGLVLNTNGVVSPTNYSVEMVFLFNSPSSWRRVLEVNNRTSENGPYISPSNSLDVWPVSPVSPGWINGAFNHIVLTNNGTTVTSFVGGGNQATIATTLLNITNMGNPALPIHFFVDSATTFPFEYSSGRVALIRMWNGVLTPSEVAQLALNPFAPVPEPSTFALGLVGLAVLGFCVTRRRKNAEHEPRIDAVAPAPVAVTSTRRRLVPCASILALLIASYLEPPAARAALVTYSSGTNIIATTFSDSQSPVAIAQGTATVNVLPGGQVRSSAAFGPAFLAQGNALVQFAGIIESDGIAVGSGVRSGIRLLDNARLFMVSGNIRENGAGIGVDRVGILAEDHSQVIMNSGAVGAVGSGLETVWTGIMALENSQISIFGGSIQTSNGLHHLRVDDAAVVTIYGTNFNYPYGPIAAFNGVLTGTLLKNGSADWDFTRTANAQIILALPEPSGGILAIAGCGGLVAIGLCRRRRHETAIKTR